MKFQDKNTKDRSLFITQFLKSKNFFYFESDYQSDFFYLIDVLL